MKKILIFFLIMFGLFSKVSANYTKLAYDFEFNGIERNTIKLSDYKGKIIVVVNVASRCGFTSQYNGLQKLWENYKDKGLLVLGVPTNDFKQEPGSNSEIKDFCEANFNVDFPMTEKINVIGKFTLKFVSQKSLISLLDPGSCLKSLVGTPKTTRSLFL